jgi:hypothetical protein
MWVKILWDKHQILEHARASRNPGLACLALVPYRGWLEKDGMVSSSQTLKEIDALNLLG